MDVPRGLGNNELWKTAARAGFRAMTRAIQGGQGAAAHNIWNNKGAWMKPTTQLPAAGKTLTTLGRGAEGVADAVVHPQHGLAVRKTYDPRGISTQEMISRKEQVGLSMGANPHVSQFYGSQQTPFGGGTQHFSEYVPAAAPGQASAQGMRDAKAGAIRGARQAGFHTAADVHSRNMVQDARTGQTKVIDMMPMRKGESVHSPGTAPSPIQLNDSGMSQFNRNAQFTGRRAMMNHFNKGAPLPQVAPQKGALAGTQVAPQVQAKPTTPQLNQQGRSVMTRVQKKPMAPFAATTVA